MVGCGPWGSGQKNSKKHGHNEGRERAERAQESNKKRKDEHADCGVRLWLW